MPPVPVPNEVICVPAVTPVPEMICPTCNVPEETAVTVSTVVLIEPVTEALFGCNVVIYPALAKAEDADRCAPNVPLASAPEIS